MVTPGARKLLFLTEKWCEGDPRFGETNTLYNILCSLDASGLAAHSALHPDEHFLRTGERIDRPLLETCERDRPDAVFVSLLCGSSLNPEPATFLRLRRAGIPLAFLWWDSVHPIIQRLAHSVAPYATMHLCLDGVSELCDDPGRFVPLWTPQDPRLYHAGPGGGAPAPAGPSAAGPSAAGPSAGAPRDIDVSFVGSVNGYHDRAAALDSLRAHGVAVHRAGGQREGRLSVGEYADLFRRSKLSLNFSRHVGVDRHQLKGRVLEAMFCGAMLLESENPQTSRLFEPYADYVPFTTEADLLEKVRHYLAHPEQRRAIADSGRRKAVREYGHDSFWRRVFGEMDQRIERDRAGGAATERAEGAGGGARGGRGAAASAADVARWFDAFRRDPADAAVASKLRRLRGEVAAHWLALPESQLRAAYQGALGAAHQQLLTTGLKGIEEGTDDPRFAGEVVAGLVAAFEHPPRASSGEAGPEDAGPDDAARPIQHLLAAQLYCEAHQFPAHFDLPRIPPWLRVDYLKFMLAPPQLFQEPGEVEAYADYMRRFVGYLHENVVAPGRTGPRPPLWKEAAVTFLQAANFIPLYFSASNVKGLYVRRAAILAAALEDAGHALDYQFPARPAGRGRIRLGFLAAHYAPQTETYSNLPAYAYLDRSAFEVVLYAAAASGHPLEAYCAARADQFVVLPPNLADQVRRIRADDVDVLIVGTNVTAVTNGVTLLALHRLARVQITGSSSVTTSGMKHADWYVSGELLEPADRDAARSHYTEQLALIEGTGLACDPAARSAGTAPPAPLARAAVGIPEAGPVFVSGANFYKILPEVERTWARLLAAIPGSHLILFPFNPNWSSSYPVQPFMRRLGATLAEHGLGMEAVTVFMPSPNRADVGERLKLADVCLDTYPFSGIHSLLDAMEVGRPVVVRDGNSMRARQGVALLRDLGLDELVAGSEQEFIDLCASLAGDPARCRRLGEEARKRLAAPAPIFDGPRYGREMERALRAALDRWRPPT